MGSFMSKTERTDKISLTVATILRNGGLAAVRREFPFAEIVVINDGNKDDNSEDYKRSIY